MSEKRNSLQLIVLKCAGVLAVGLFATAGPAAADDVGTAFTYQGDLQQGGTPVDEPVDGCAFEFSLWNDPVDGAPAAQVGSTLMQTELVDGGRFTATLDFGDDIFTGQARWLEIAVCCPAPCGSPTTLIPRQELTPSPYALALPAMRNTPSGHVGIPDSPNVIGGHHDNSVGSLVGGATIAGGGNTGFPNSVTQNFGTVGGGLTNTASGVGSTIGGGVTNTASDSDSTIGGGQSNTASGLRSTVGGGNVNVASGDYATVAGGAANKAAGNYSFAAGRRAKANFNGMFVWADNHGADFPAAAEPNFTPADKQFLVRAKGGAVFVTATDSLGSSTQTVELTTAGDVVASGTLTSGSSITIDGTTDTITATGGTISFDNENLTTSGLVESTVGGFKFPDATIQTSADTLASLSCSNDEVAKWNGAAWNCAADDTGVGAGNTLDDAYDQGGAGAGRTITADSGAVSIAGPDGLTVLGTITSGSSVIIDGTAANGKINSTSGDLILQTSGVSRMRINQNAGNVGIGGAIAPNRRLAVRGPGESADGDTGLVFIGQDPIDCGFGCTFLSWMNIDPNEIDAWSSLVGITISNNLHLNSNSGGDVTIAKGGGSVGIGINPSELLHVAGNVRADRGVELTEVTRTLFLGGARQGTAAPYATIEFQNYDDDSGMVEYVGAEIRSHNSGGAVTGDLRFLTHDGTIFDERMRIHRTGRVGMGRVASANVLEVEGTASKTAAGTWAANSDRRIKTDIETVAGALNTLDKVRLVSFKYTDQYKADHPSLKNRRYMNVIAQEFAEVFPDYVKGSGEKLPNSDQEILQVDSYPLTIYAAAAVQELHEMVKDQQERIASLEKKLIEVTVNGGT